MKTLAWCAAMVVGLGAVCVWAEDVARPTTGEEKLIAGFEEAKIHPDWYVTSGEMTACTEHATEGKQSLKLALAAGDYPGFGLELHGTDWSQYDAIRFSIFCDARDSQWVTIRFDDTASRGYQTRINFEDPSVAVRFNPGMNEVELPIASMRQGTPESQGINVSRIKQLRVFAGGLKKPVNWYLDNLRLVRVERKGPDVLCIADFDKVQGKFEATGGAETETVDAPEGAGGKALKVKLGAGGYSGLAMTVPQDWLGYDAVVFNVYCPEDSATPGGVSFKIKSADGRAMMLGTELQKGMNEVYLPLELASWLSLSRVREFNLVWSPRGAQETVLLDNIRLERVKLFDVPTRHAVAADTDRFVVDYTGLKVSRNTDLMTTVWVPLKAGGYRVVRCNSPNKAQDTYGLDAEALEGWSGKPLRVWSMVLDHGVWMWCETQISLKAEGQTRLAIDNNGRFGN